MQPYSEFAVSDSTKHVVDKSKYGMHATRKDGNKNSSKPRDVSSNLGGKGNESLNIQLQMTDAERNMFRKVCE